ncbi:ShlB/FhaC/HecB family hemolysin secretion/activation protein [Selenomonas ruminantium]|uniref:Hemolysin activation/secretion protein n=1 Tax=Selenomonas ruminantium TaxID=971 RepID=A0A1H0N4J5_SELRU|nr:ShlB/FhaC/HecB family hemolysin secretion/activation protein [Selenomonas ruminantium]SDO87425.1 Hemolysin activation/secretion protein [Selenomonas ruminantium]
MKMSKSLSLTIIAGIIAGSQAAVAAAPAGGMDASAQLERERRAMERERALEQIAEDEAAKNKKAEQAEKSSAAETGQEIRFDLKQVNCTFSEILAQDEIQAVTGSYIGRQVTLKVLQEMAEKITDIYRQKGYMTCGAVLPPQRIHDGVVEIRLIEGKTGEVTIKGNRYTKTKYIADRLWLTAGKIANTDKLNRDLRWFHGTNDIQLRVVLKPGSQEGTTDYEIMAFEPQNQTVTLYVDNDGYETSGRWREGLFYNMRSLTGHRDALRSSFLRSQGTKAWSLGYSFPVSKKGMRLDLNYAANRTEVTKGELKPLGVKGKSASYSLTWRVPFHMTEHSRHEAGLQYVHQTAETDLGHGTRLVVPWVDDKIRRVIPYTSFTHYGNSTVFYHKHSFVLARRSDIDGKSDTASLYRLNSFWQKRYKNGQFWQGRLDGQWSSADNLASSDRFFIGGVNSVRGYEEGFIGGERGLTAGIEYHIPLDKAKRFYVFPFFDWGTVAGETAPEHRNLMSTGVGLEAKYKYLYSTLSVGFPIKKDFYEKHLDSTRFDFSLSATF